jgi:hypothetical protein
LPRIRFLRREAGDADREKDKQDSQYGHGYNTQAVFNG